MTARKHLYAIDVAFTFNSGDIAPLYQANRELFAEWPRGFCFNSKHRPHVTLLQAYLHKEDISTLNQEISKIVAQINLKTPPLTLELVEFYSSDSFNSEAKVAGVEVRDPSGRTKQLHSQLATIARKWHHEEGDSSAFRNQEASEGSRQWVQNYIFKSSHENFHPHITLGFGSDALMDKLKEQLPLPLHVKPQFLVNAQLGNHCTVSDYNFGQWPL